MSEQLERNKKTVEAFFDLMFNQCKPAEAIERYAGEVYIQHNPGVSDGCKRRLKSVAPGGQKTWRPWYQCSC